jgi:hypothetical protein
VDSIYFSLVVTIFSIEKSNSLLCLLTMVGLQVQRIGRNDQNLRRTILHGHGML